MMQFSDIVSGLLDRAAKSRSLVMCGRVVHQSPLVMVTSNRAKMEKQQVKATRSKFREGLDPFGKAGKMCRPASVSGDRRGDVPEVPGRGELPGQFVCDSAVS